MANQCGHIHYCFECGKDYICWSPECFPLVGETVNLCPKCSYFIWVRTKGIEETGVVQ